MTLKDLIAKVKGGSSLKEALEQWKSTIALRDTLEMKLIRKGEDHENNK